MALKRSAQYKISKQDTQTQKITGYKDTQFANWPKEAKTKKTQKQTA